MPSSSASTTESRIRTWDGSPQTKYDWFESLPDTLDGKSSASFRTMWQSGYAVERTKVVVSSTEHAAHLSIGNLSKQPFEKPTPPLSFKVVDATKDITGIKVDPTRYVVAPEILEAKDRDLFAAIAETIENRKRVQDYEKKSGGSGLNLISILADEIDTASAEISQWAARRLADIVAAGIQAPTTVGFDHFRQEYESTNRRMTSSRRNAESVIADTYAAAVRQLGDNIGTRLDMQLMLAKHAKIATGSSKSKALNLEETVTCLHEVLSDSELRGTGQVLKGKEVKKPPPLVWTEGKHEVCSVCNGKHGGGRHLRRDCPDRNSDPVKKVKFNSPREDKPAKGSAKRAASHDGDAEDSRFEWEDDVSLSALFADDDPPNLLYPELPDPPSGEVTGSALVYRQQRTPNSGAGASRPSPSMTRSPASSERARQLVERLSPASPMSEFSEVRYSISDSTVSLRTGGPDRRSRLEILSELRAEVGLDPMVIPVGTPIGPLVALPPPPAPPEVDSSDSDDDSVNASDDPPREAGRPSNAREHSDTPSHQHSSNPLELVWIPGAPKLTSYAVSTDDLGQMCHTFNFSTTPPRSWKLIDGSDYLAARPPPRAILLGKSIDNSVRYWGSEAGLIVACSVNEASPHSSHPTSRDVPPSTPTPTRERRRSLRERVSPVRDVALAVMTLASALVALTVANSPYTQEPPFEPGRLLAPNLRAMPVVAVDSMLVAIYLIVLMLSLCARQANAGGGRTARTRRGRTTPSHLAQWAPLYQHDWTEAYLDACSRPANWTDLLLFPIRWCKLAVVSVLCLLALKLRLRVSPSATGRCMLPTSKILPPPRGALSSLMWAILCAILVATTLCLDPIGTIGISYIGLCVYASDDPLANVSRRSYDFHESVRSSLEQYFEDEMELIAKGPPSDAAQSPLPGRALRSSQKSDSFPTASSPPGWSTSRPVRRWIDLVIDSGCTWHVHNRLDELINVRSCDDSVEDASGKRVRCTHQGDLPLIIRSTRGVELKFLLRDVRWASSFTDSLISVDQLWENSKADCVFRDQRRVEFTLNKDGQGIPISSSFRRIDGLFRWTVGIARVEADSHRGGARQLKAGIHSARSHSHLHSLPADQLARLLHRRLHVGTQHLRQLGSLAGDVPDHIANAAAPNCSHCAEANSSRLPHSQSVYEPSHAGRLIHLDIAGPFTPSEHGGFRYCLLMVDDHSRFKFAYFLHKRSDAPSKVEKFIAEFNSMASLHSDTPIRGVGTIRTDGAGELVSREFAELLDQNHISHVTSPPHVHQLNGVAERAIRSTLSLARSYLTASGLSSGYWTHAVEMAVDVLNRTSGPCSSKGGRTSYELLTGRRPSVMSIMPFGCRAFAVKPRSQYSKTTIDPRAWVGLNLGKSRASPQAYKIWCPAAGRVVVTSDAYFMEHVFPSRAKGFQVDDDVNAVPTKPDADENADADNTGHALTSSGADALTSRVLVLFSGSYSRPDGLAALLRRKGLEVDEVDSDPTQGDPAHDILKDDFFLHKLELARQGHYACVFAAPPCSTYSVARFFTPKRGKSGAPPVRSREHILGLPQLPPGHEAEVRKANEITRRSCAILRAAQSSGADFVVENPADRGDASLPHLFQFAEHGPLWLDPHMRALQSGCNLSAATFAQCMVGGLSQKYTTLWYTAGLSSLDSLRGLWCHHAVGSHKETAGGEFDEASSTWNSARAAAYPTDLNVIFADAIYDSIVARRMLSPERPTRETKLSPDEPSPKFASTMPAVGEAAVPPPPTERLEPDAPPTPIISAAADSAISDPASDTPAPTGPLDETSSPAAKPKRKYEKRVVPLRSLGPFPTRHSFAKVAAALDDDPATHAEAMRMDAAGWGVAEATEISNHEGNTSWEYIPRSELPSGRRVVKLTWVFKTKRGPERKKKARLCVQGCSQVHGVDYDQTFCAALRAGSLRTLCAIAARLSLQMYRWDFVAAYLQGQLEPGEVVYCTPPSGFATAEIDGTVRLVPREQGDGVQRLCKVVRPVYGMAQAGRRWQRTLFPWLLDWKNGGAKLSQSNYDPCVFHCSCTVSTKDGPRDEKLFVGCYVDDLFILASHTDEHSIYHQFTSDLSRRWNVEDEGPVSDLLSIEIDRVDDQVRLRQTKYIEKMLNTYAPDGVPSTPLATHKLSAQQPSRPPCGSELPQLVADALTQESQSVDPTLLKAYQSLTGALLYCAVNTRPDVAYSVGMLCRAMGKPTAPLLNAAYRVLYYLFHHRSVGLHYAASELDLTGMSDADWAVHHSTSGFLFTYNQAAISWSSKKQSCVALSSCEAEIVALSEAAKEGVYLSNFLDDLGMSSGDPVSLATDNSAARDLAYNPEHHERTKHIERRHFFVRDMVENHRLVVPYVSTVDNLADFFTKPLEAANFYRLRNAIMNLPPRESTHSREGGCRNSPNSKGEGKPKSPDEPKI